MVLPDLDEYCKKIFAFLVLHDEPIRFNELYKSLNSANYKISRPTLIAHLKHLQKRKIIKKRIGGTQNVSYSVDYSTVKNLQFHKDFSKVAENIQKSKETFNSFDVAEKIRYISFKE
jgi:DNA-binding HxlR family transcriptional regulator